MTDRPANNNNAMTHPGQAEMLGQLLAAQSILDVLPSDQELLDYLCRVISKVPGVKAAHASHLAAPPVEPATLDPAISPDGQCHLDVRTAANFFGRISLQVNDRESFLEYVPYLGNFITTAALNLENRLFARMKDETHQQLIQSRDQLEHEVAERTHQLQQEIEIRRSHESALKETEELYRATFELAAVGISHTDLDGHMRLVNQKFCEILGYSAEELSTLRYLDITHVDDVGPNLENIRRLLAGECNHFSMEKRFIRKNGSLAWVHLTTALRRDLQTGVPLHFIAVIHDITSSKMSQARIEHLANHDLLTQLPNRHLLLDRLNHAIDQASQLKHMVAVLFLDLDRFKGINDSLGHDIGDLLLQVMAKRLGNAARKGDTVARLGGDEFVVVLENVKDIEEVSDIAHAIINAIAQPVTLDSHQLSVTTSIGCSVYPRDGSDAFTLLKHADLAMYKAKDVSLGSFRFFQADMNAKLLERLLTENALRRALEKDELVLHYQPRQDARSGHIIGVEALVRWRHPERGLISPDEFIPLAEEIGLIGAIGQWVLQTACAQNIAWLRKGLPRIKMAVNLSAHQLNTPVIVETVREALTDTQMDAELLELEITETGLMQNIEPALDALLKIKGAGVAISIDDFGTGYSSLSYLKRLPIHALKVDRSFINGIPGDSDDVAIVTATIAMAHSMGLRVVAEGVTAHEQVVFLNSHQCDELQGYLISRPLPAEEIEAFLVAAHSGQAKPA